ncbi:uncharacterized protein LOC126964618 [Leptidea sinapis]|uniref:uncharacterized protein LOC126964618 n=1 Tax=Leptidea sinapis TaxID=189913 RepID=UPI00212B0D18|nr:uncharacterized protein LOC126964618 [Leptidea sinapis]
MEQIQSVPVSLPIVQVYQPSVSIHPSLNTQGKMSYQDSEPIQIPMTHNISNHLLTQNQTVISCQQIQLQNVQTLQAQNQVLHNDINQQLQITSHVIVPQPIYKQHLLTGTVQHQYYGQYVEYLKEHLITKVEDTPHTEQLLEQETESSPADSCVVAKEVTVKTRLRSDFSNPNNWACNIRKLKHQKGEAYINRRGKYVPEKHIRNTKDCLKACRYKCNERINDADRHSIFEAFYSLNTNEKKHFLLSTTERHQVRNTETKYEGKRNYTFKYFFVIRSERHVVCKNFYLGTLAISQKPVYNVHLNKSDLNLPKPDGRGLSESSVHAVPNELKDRVRQHIISFTTIDTKPIKQFSRRRQYLDSSFNIKYMYTLYCTECTKDNVAPVKESMYRKIFHDEFNLYFKKNKASLCGKCKEPLKKS